MFSSRASRPDPGYRIREAWIDGTLIFVTPVILGVTLNGSIVVRWLQALSRSAGLHAPIHRDPRVASRFDNNVIHGR